MGCIQRVWDSGDTTDCGRGPVIGETGCCMECLKWRMQGLLRDENEHRAKADALRKEHDRYAMALEDHEFPLLSRMRRTG